jgi:hypothetical protein
LGAVRARSAKALAAAWGLVMRWAAISASETF